MDSFIERVIADEDTHVLLAQIFFYGTDVQGVVGAKCRRNLDKILLLDDETVLAKMVEVAMRCLDKSEYSELSRDILIRYSKDRREKIRHMYQWCCSDISVEDFNLFMTLSADWIPKGHVELHDQLKYLKKCISRHPLECFEYIRKNDCWNSVGRYDLSEVTELLLEIYKKLKLDEDSECLEEIMDTFDYLLFENEHVVKEALDKIDN